MIYIYTLTYPGFTIDINDIDFCNKVQNYLSDFEGVLAELSLSVSYFEIAYKDLENSMPSPGSITHNVKYGSPLQIKRRRISYELESEFKKKKLQMSEKDFTDLINFEAEKRAKLEYWSEGNLPRGYRLGLCRLYARSFLYGAERIQKILELIDGEIKSLIEKTKTKGDDITMLIEICRKFHIAKKEFENNFSELTELRNSSAHYEDRVRGVAKKKQKVTPINLKPLDNELGKLDKVSFLGLEYLYGNKFASTIHSGKEVRIEVSIKSLIAIQKTVQDTVDSFPWNGTKNLRPIN